MSAPGGPLAAALNPLGHVRDEALFEGLLWDDGDGSTLESVFESLAGIGLTKHVLMFFVAGGFTVLFFGSYAWQIGRSRVPGRWGSFVEFVIEFVRDQMVRPFMGEDGDRFLPLIVTFFVYIAFCNLLGLIPFFDLIGKGGNTATASITITAGLAICSFVIYHAIGIREQGGFGRYVKNLFPHVPLFMLPVIVIIELVAHIIRPCALAIRLFANMLAGHTMAAVLLGFTGMASGLTGGVVTAASVAGITALTFLELIVAIIQAFVFAFLTAVFLSMAVHPEH